MRVTPYEFSVTKPIVRC